MPLSLRTIHRARGLTRLTDVVGSVVAPPITPAAAQRIATSAARTLTPIGDVMSPAPTVNVETGTTSSLSGASSAFGAGMYQVNDPAAFRPLNCTLITSGTSAYIIQTMTGNVSNSAKRTGAGAGVATRTSAPAIDFVARGGNARMVICVTDVLTGARLRISVNDILGSTFAAQYVTLTFGSARDRIIEIYCGASGNYADGTTFRGALQFRGANCTAGYTLVAPPVDPVAARIAIIGDSHADHILDEANLSTINDVKLAYPDYLSAKLGNGNIWCLAAPGTGFLNPVGTSGTYRQRIAAGDLNEATIGPMDLVILAGTTNDDPDLIAANTDAAIQAEVQATVAAAMAAQPNAIIAVAGPLGRAANPTRVTPQSRYDAMKAGTLAAANGDKRVIWIDNSPLGAPDITAGNVGTMVGAGGTHLTKAGAAYVGNKRGNEILAACNALLAA